MFPRDRLPKLEIFSEDITYSYIFHDLFHGKPLTRQPAHPHSANLDDEIPLFVGYTTRFDSYGNEATTVGILLHLQKVLQGSTNPLNPN